MLTLIIIIVTLVWRESVRSNGFPDLLNVTRVNDVMFSCV